MRGDVAVQMRDHPLRQVVRLDLIGDGEPLQLRHQAPVAAYDTSDQAFVPEVIESAVLAIALARRVNQGEIAWLADRLEILLFGGKVEFLQSNRDFLGKADADEAT